MCRKDSGTRFILRGRVAQGSPLALRPFKVLVPHVGLGADLRRIGETSSSFDLNLRAKTKGRDGRTGLQGEPCATKNRKGGRSRDPVGTGPQRQEVCATACIESTFLDYLEIGYRAEISCNSTMAG